VGQSPANPVASPDGETVYVTNWNQAEPALYVLDAETLAERYRVHFPEPLGTLPHGLCVTADGSTLYTTHEYGNSVFKIEVGKTEQDTHLTPIPLGDPGPGLRPLQVILDATESFAYVTCFGTGEVRVIDLALGEMVQVIPIGGNPWLEALTPDGSKIFVGNWGKNGVDVIDTSTRTVESLTNAGRPNPIFARPHGVAISDDGRYAFVSNENTNDVIPPHHGGSGNLGAITVIDVETNQVVKSLVVELDPTGLAFVAH
jgi:YVTN family beta-propeller protein